MAVQAKDYLKTRFESGDTPSAQDFTDLVDSLVAVSTDFICHDDEVVSHEDEVVTLT